MPYAYYAKLTTAEQAMYRASDRHSEVTLPDPGRLMHKVKALEKALGHGERSSLQRAVDGLGNGILAELELAPARFSVLAARPQYAWGELHGDYAPGDGRRRAVIRVWMRTARHKRIVAFKTFLRTLLHELCHHLDYELYGLADSLHTEGFFKRESSLFKQLTRVDQPTAAR